MWQLPNEGLEPGWLCLVSKWEEVEEGQLGAAGVVECRVAKMAGMGGRGREWSNLNSSATINVSKLPNAQIFIT